MKRYAVFAGTRFYATGGANDLVGFADTLEEAWDLVDAVPYFDTIFKTGDGAWCHAMDVTTGALVPRDGWKSEGIGFSIREEMNRGRVDEDDTI